MTVATIGGNVDPQLTYLSQRLSLTRTGLKPYDDYYDGNQPVAYVAPEVARAVGDRLATVIVNWPQLVLDALEERLDIEGFRLASDQPADDEIWRIWQANNLDGESQVCHLDTLLYGRSYALVWYGDDDAIPSITVESPHQMEVLYRPGTRQVLSALKQWWDGDRWVAYLYLPDRVERYESTPVVRPVFVPPMLAPGTLRLVDTTSNPLGVVPVVPFVNRRRTLDLDGHSELEPIIPLADAVNKLTTDMMVTSEFHAMPRRWATGIDIPRNPGDRDRFRAEVKQYWDDATAGKTWLGGQGMQFGQFAEANLDNFVNSIRMLTGQIAALAGLPPHYVGIIGSHDNPASADAIRSAEASLVRRAQRKQRVFGESWEKVIRLALLVRDGQPYPGGEMLETIWRDPQTPTIAQAADAAVKLVSAGIYDDEEALEDLGKTPVQIQRLRERKQQAAADAATAPIQARMELARQFQEQDGLSQNGALAAAGLIQAAQQNAD